MEPNPKRPSIAVIIPTLNEAARVARAVKSAVRAGANQVIVADGGSDDETPRIAASAGATVIRSEKGRGTQQNTGTLAADDADVYLFLHADNWLGEASIGQIRACWSADVPLVGAFCQRIDALGARFRLLEIGNRWRVTRLGQPYGDQAIFVSSPLFHDVGGFPQVRLMEEIGLMRTLRRTVRPILLPGPVFVDARRWNENGVIRQTIQNWSLVVRYVFGASPERLAKAYSHVDHRLHNLESPSDPASPK